jgi:hypothetical protein
MLQKYSLVRLLEAFRSAFPLCFVTHSCDIAPYFVSLAKGGINSVSPRWSPIPDHVSSKSDTKTTAVFNKTVRSSGMRTASDVYSSFFRCTAFETRSSQLLKPKAGIFRSRDLLAFPRVRNSGINFSMHAHRPLLRASPSPLARPTTTTPHPPLLIYPFPSTSTSPRIIKERNSSAFASR